MRNIFFTLFALCFAACSGGGAEDEVSNGSIYGVITDKATGEPIQSAGVQLSPGGTKTVTGSEGQYEFTELDPGSYTISVEKTGYADLSGHSITVVGGQSNKGDVQLQLLPPTLRITNNDKQDITDLDFGNANADATRSFNIFNDGWSTLEWDIVESCDWIIQLSAMDGTLAAGATQSIVVTIDRSKLASGNNTTKLHVVTNNGSKELSVAATNDNIKAELNVLEATNIASSSAMFNATIVSAGTPSYSERGFVYSTSPMPTLENTVSKLTSPVTEDEDYFANATLLLLGQTYYVRAYAINVAGISYSSNEISFIPTASAPTLSTQAATNINISAGTATFNGTILNVGDPAYTERGFVWGVTQNPTVDDTKKISTGTGTGAFSANITDIVEGKTYYVRAYAISPQGVAYGTQATLNFIGSMPELTTEALTNINIGAGTATFNGTILTVGDLAYTERGFVYATVHNPTIDDNKKVVSGSGAGAFSVNASGIAEGNIYYIRAYATNVKGTAYGSEISFDFNPKKPTLSTKGALNLNETSATLYGEILTIGDPAYTEKGFVYGTLQNPTIEDDLNKIASGAGVGSYSVNVSGLTTGNRYYVRAYATNVAGTTYAEQISFIASEPDYIVVGNLLIQKTDISSADINYSSSNNMCNGSGVGDYNDWRLPNSEELALIYQNRTSIGNFMTTEAEKIMDSYDVQTIGGINYHTSYHTNVHKEYCYWSSNSNPYSALNFSNASIVNSPNPADVSKTISTGSYGSDQMVSNNYAAYYRERYTQNYRARCVRTLP